MKNYLSTSAEVCELAKQVLSSSEYKEAGEISQSLATGTPTLRREARNTLYSKLKLPQPLHSENLRSAQEAIQYLPQNRRDSIGFLVDYVDELVKAMTFDFTKDSECKESPLGVNVQKLNSDIHAISRRLINNLQAYDSVFYTPDKNDFIKEGKECLLSASETIYLAFITLKLANEITKASNYAKLVNNGRESIKDL